MKKRFLVGMVSLAMAVSPVMPVFAAEDVLETSQAGIEDTAEVYRADVIVMKYRMYNGVMQCRHWNETKGVWVDPAWIDM